ncbi:MAG: orotate phosphoribosyltransferase [Candidatus Thorarchaeota archaeon]|jgi:orotate phosphoribosyltransferase
MPNDLETLKTQIMTEIYQKRMLLTSVRDRREGWTLVSGLWSPFYVQLRLLSSFPETLEKVGKAMAILLENEAPDVNKIIGIAFAGVPIATAISLGSKLPACHTRKIVGARTEEDLKRAIEEYGQHSMIEGVIEDGDVLCIVDDLVTRMESKLVARAQVLAEIERRNIRNVSCNDIAVVIDRQQGAKERAGEFNLKLHSLIGLVDEGFPILRDVMSPQEYDLVTGYLVNPQEYPPPE